MKVIGKTQSGFICEIEKSELNRIATGQNNPSNFDCEKSIGAVINISQMFESVRRIESFKTNDDYQSVRKQLKDMLEAFEPVAGFVEHTQEQIKGMR